VLRRRKARDVIGGPLPGEAVQVRAASTSSEQLLPGLTIEDLRCPICFDFAWSAYQCPNGHVLCRSCLATLPRRPVRGQRVCPTCRVAFDHDAFGRNLVLEHILETAQLPCRNGGCAAVLPGADLQAHAAVCGHRAVSCPACPEVLPAVALRAHALAKHAEPWVGPEKQRRIMAFADGCLAVAELASWGCDGHVDYWADGGKATRIKAQYHCVRGPSHASAETTVEILLRRGQPGTVVTGRLELGALASHPSERYTVHSYSGLRISFEPDN
jgi:hypothetical protein